MHNDDGHACDGPLSERQCHIASRGYWADLMLYPVLPIIMPTDLAGVPNGKLPAKLLRNIKTPNGQLHSLAATAWNAMQLAAYFDGIELKHVGAYRPLSEQMALFNNRYALSPTGRKPQVTRTYLGKTWYLKKGLAMLATPGKSQHNLGIAVDVSTASGPRLAWMLANEHLYGFSHEVQSEPWHIRFTQGNQVPPAVAAFLAAKVA